MRTAVLFVTAVLATVSSGCGSAQDGEAILRARVHHFAELMSGQRYAEAWAFTSRRFRAGNDDDAVRWAEYIERSGAVLKGMELQAMQLADDRAIVRALTTIQANGKTLREVEQQVWIMEDGQWVFDEYVAVD